MGKGRKPLSESGQSLRQGLVLQSQGCGPRHHLHRAPQAHQGRVGRAAALLRIRLLPGIGYNKEINRSLIAKMTFYIHPFMENTDDKNVSIGEWGIENEMVTGPESIQVLSDVTI